MSKYVKDSVGGLYMKSQISQMKKGLKEGCKFCLGPPPPYEDMWTVRFMGRYYDDAHGIIHYIVTNTERRKILKQIEDFNVEFCS